MNEQEIIKRLKDVMPEDPINDFQRGKETGLTYALELVEELEKPVVPQFVADMIIKRKTAGQSVIKAIENLRFYEDACKWVRNNGETFVKAWLYGYEVEKEKLYTVELPNPNRADVSLVLGLYNDGKVAIFAAFTDSWKYEKQYKLTEAEIKQDFEWAWQFAKEVEE